MFRSSALVFALALALVACTGDAATTSTTLPDVSSAPTTGETSTTVPSSTTTTAAAIPNGPLPGTENLPPEVTEELIELVGITEEVRGLQFVEMPVVTVVTEEELATRVQEQIAEDAEDFPADEALYQLLGLLSEDTNLEAMLVELYGEQVAGYYDGEVGELVVPIREDGFSVVQRATLIHELTHALTDQTLRLRRGLRRHDRGGPSRRGVGVSGVDRRRCLPRRVPLPPDAVTERVGRVLRRGPRRRHHRPRRRPRVHPETR